MAFALTAKLWPLSDSRQ